MTIYIKPHGGTSRLTESTAVGIVGEPLPRDVSSDAEADFGYYFPPSGVEDHYFDKSDETLLDMLAESMIPDSGAADVDATPDSELAPVITYWGQFLDHELTANTDRANALSNIFVETPVADASDIEANLKNARTPRFDLDSVYGGALFGRGSTAATRQLVGALRDPDHPAKMRVGTNAPVGEFPSQNNSDDRRDLPRFGQVDEAVRAAFREVSNSSEDTLSDDALSRKALIGDMRNDENLLVGQFHLTFLRFHNAVVDFIEVNPELNLMADYSTARDLSRLHYQDLILSQYLPAICDVETLQRVIDEKAESYFSFQRQYADRNTGTKLGKPMPLEFSVAAFRFGHTMVRNVYDHNAIFSKASFNQLFQFTGNGGMADLPTLPRNWIIDWNRFTQAQSAAGSELPARKARKIDTHIAPPLQTMRNETLDESSGDGAIDARRLALLKNLPQRNLRRGLNLRIPTGQALHAYLRSQSAVSTDPQTDVAAWIGSNDKLKTFLKNEGQSLRAKTPLWFYILAEAESGGGNHLGPVGSWIVASTFVATLLDDPDSALSVEFTAAQSPLRTPAGDAISTFDDWIDFAGVRV